MILLLMSASRNLGESWNVSVGSLSAALREKGGVFGLSALSSCDSPHDPSVCTTALQPREPRLGTTSYTHHQYSPVLLGLGYQNKTLSMS